MRTITLFMIVLTINLYGQNEFWAHHSFDYPIKDLIKSKNNVVYAVSDSTVLKSTDCGLNWAVIYRTPTFCSSWKVSISDELPEETTIIIRPWYNGSPQPVQISTDAGQSWQIMIYPGGYYDNSVINSSGQIYLITDTLYLSTDKGISWNEVNIPGTGSLSGGLAIDTSNNIFASKLFIQELDPFTRYPITRVYRSTDNGLTWGAIILAPYTDIDKIFTASSNDCFTSLINYGPSGGGTIYHFKNNSLRTYNIGWFGSAIVNGNDIIYAAGTNIFYSLNDGHSWRSENSGLPGIGTHGLIKDSLGYLYTGTTQGIYKSNFSTFKFSNEAQIVFDETKILDTTLKVITIKNPYSFNLQMDSIKCTSELFFIADVSDSTIHPGDSIIVLMEFSPITTGEFNSHMLLYANEIASRIETIGNSKVPVVIQLPFDEEFGNILVGDTVFKPISFTTQSINTLVIDSVFLKRGTDFFIPQFQPPILMDENDTLTFNIAFAPTSRFVKRDTLVLISNGSNSPTFQMFFGFGINPTNIDEEEESIKDFDLSNSYPNPFNLTTKIEFSVPHTSQVTIKIYNMIGEEIDVLVDEIKSMGKYKLDFISRNLPSGIYFYRMQSDYFNKVKKFILLK